MDPVRLFSLGYWIRFCNNHAEAVVAAATKIVLILAVYIIVRIILHKLINRLAGSMLARVGENYMQARKARVRALQTVLRSVVGFVLGFIAAVMIVQAIGFNILPLITTASVAGLAIGFGAQKLVRDVISGFFILVEDQYGVGDYVTICGVTGVVEDLGMRTTWIRDRNGKLSIIANGDIAQVVNYSRGTLLMVHDVPVAAAADLDKAKSVLGEVGQAMARDMPKLVKEPFRVEGLSQVSGAAVTVRLVGAISARAQEDVQLEMNARIRKAFQENDLQLA